MYDSSKLCKYYKVTIGKLIRSNVLKSIIKCKILFKRKVKRGGEGFCFLVALSTIFGDFTSFLNSCKYYNFCSTRNNTKNLVPFTLLSVSVYFSLGH